MAPTDNRRNCFRFMFIFENFHHWKSKSFVPGVPLKTKNTSWMPFAPDTGACWTFHWSGPPVSGTATVPARGPSTLSRWTSIEEPAAALATQAARLFAPLDPKSTLLTLM